MDRQFLTAPEPNAEVHVGVLSVHHRVCSCCAEDALHRHCYLVTDDAGRIVQVGHNWQIMCEFNGWHENPEPVLEERSACVEIVEAGARRWLELGGKKPAPFRQFVSEALLHVAKQIRNRTEDDRQGQTDHSPTR